MCWVSYSSLATGGRDEGKLGNAEEGEMGKDLSTEEVKKEFDLSPQPGGAQYRVDDQNRFTDIVVMRFGYRLHGIYGTTEVVLTGNDAQENENQIERASNALNGILGTGTRLAASYIWEGDQLILENQHRQL